MDKHIEELSKPVAWTDAEELQDMERGYSGYLFKSILMTATSTRTGK
ncbi:hypothetical protein [Yersinia entomophaga]|nr:hypothetical protein [Yersinia entomophaga]